MGEHIPTIFVFAVFLISLFTDGYFYGIASAIGGMLAVNYVFTYPYYAFDFNIPVNLISALIMTTVSVLTGMLTTKVRQFEAEKAESERERMRANLLRAVSHDLRTPLTTIYSACSILRSKKKMLTDEQQETMLKNIEDDSRWLIRMVENLLSVTRINNDQIEIAKTPVILDELIDSVMTTFLNRYPEQKVSIDLPDDVVVIAVDTNLMEQVLMNLLENAVFHAEQMTHISLTVFVRKDSLTPIIVLSARTHDRDKVSALDAGANDYVTKPFSSDELLARIRMILRNYHYRADSGKLPGGKFQVQDLVIDYDARQIFIGGREIKLSQTEYNIVALLSANCGKMMTYTAIIKGVWGYPDEGSTKKLQVNMANIRKKFGVKPGEATYITNELGVGYRMNAAENITTVQY